MTDAVAPYDYKRFALLFVDDEEKARKYFRRLFGETFRILDASDGNEAYDVFQAHPKEIGVIVTDQRMPNETGSAFLARLGEDAEDVVKILSTAYSDLDAAIDSVNRGGIYRYMTKPWDIPELELTLKRAMEFFIVKHERDALMHAKVRALSDMLFASRLASFALVPIAAGLECHRAAEAVADFVRFGAARESHAEPNTGLSGEWRTRHERQLGFASKLKGKLETTLKAAAGAEGLAAIQPLIGALASAAPKWDPQSGMLELAANPFPDLLGVLLGRDDAEDPDSAATVLAGMMAFYNAGGRLVRKRIAGAYALKATANQAAAETSPGDEAARWLFDDELLLSTALGLL